MKDAAAAARAAVVSGEKTGEGEPDGDPHRGSGESNGAARWSAGWMTEASVGERWECCFYPHEGWSAEYPAEVAGENYSNLNARARF